MENTTTSETRDLLTDDISRLKEDVAKLTADAKKRGQAHIDDVKQRLNDAVSSAQAQVAAHPFAVLGVGIALGFLFGRRSRRR